MRQLPRILFITGATVIVIVALLVSGLRLVLPHLDHWREPMLAKISAMTGSEVQAQSLSARWENFGPVLNVNNLSVTLPKQGDVKVDRITLALDVWQSLLHGRWQFRDLTFWQLHLNSTQPLFQGNSERATLQPNELTDLFLHQFDHFDLRDSTIRFQTPSGDSAELQIPRLTWLNEDARHRAEGEVSLSSFNGQHGVLQVRLDLSDQKGLLDNGRVWMQADDVDVTPWLGQWMRDNTTLQSARFSLSTWLTLQEGVISAGDLLLKQGGASWRERDKTHSLEVDNVTAHLTREGGGWAVAIPQTHLTTDGVRWPQGHVALLWKPDEPTLPGPDHTAELRVRASHLDLARVDPLVPLFSALSPQLLENWRMLQPRGTLNVLAVDIPLQQPERTRFQANWRDLSWQPWKLLPGMQNFSGALSGSVQHGRLNLAIQQATVPYPDMFHAPLEIQRATGEVDWQKGLQGLQLQGRDLDVQARALWAKGDFTWAQPQEGNPRLDILAGINLQDAAQAWRYFPEPLMGQHLVDYLTGALKGGHVSNATLLFAGNPHDFPFRRNQGQFQVAVPLRDATYEFEPGWPALTNLDIDLDFLNNGLWMLAPSIKLGNVDGKNISAVIPDYLEEKLIIDGNLSGDGKEVSNYFLQTPLDDSLGAALEQLQIGGNVRSRLNLDIPLDGKPVLASGNVVLNNNSLFIKPLDSTLTNLTGRFRYNNGNLESEELNGKWFGQPTAVTFTTDERPNDYQVSVKLLGDWALNQLKELPKAITSKLEGSVPWQGDVAITLPHKGGATYDVNLQGSLKSVSSRLPAPLQKEKGEDIPVALSARGDLTHFDLSGVVNKTHRFNSRLLLEDRVTLDRGIWVNGQTKTPPLPDHAGMVLNLPALDGEAWLGLLTAGTEGGNQQAARLPGQITLNSPTIALGGQQWHDVSTELAPLSLGGTQVNVRSKELTGSLSMPQTGRWKAQLKYLYFNPQWGESSEASPLSQRSENRLDFSRWPALDITCEECWVRGQKLGRVEAGLTPNHDVMTLSGGLIDTGNARMNVSGEWVNRANDERSSLKGTLSGKKINDATNWFGMNSPLQDAPFNLDFDLHWRSAPWDPATETLSGVLNSSIGAGHIADVNTGRAGQLLRLFSFDALLRKLRFDFSDTFNQGFYFDSIKGTAWIKDGVMQTENLLVDGLEADIAMQGKIDLARRRIDMEAVVAPEISASVGVAAAFAVNPIVGAAVFAASKVLGPLWNKISLLRYHISGPLDKPQINEVLRKPREK